MPITNCPSCGEPCQPSQIVCLKCGNMLLDGSSSTVSIRDPELTKIRRKREQEESNHDMNAEHRVGLLIRGMIERLTFEEGTEIVLGRVDLNNPASKRFDLTRFGALERGVSREHAVLRFKDNVLSVADLGSVNGTKLNDLKLEPNQFHVIHDNDELLLGRLTIGFRFDVTPAKTTTSEFVEPKTIPFLPLSAIQPEAPAPSTDDSTTDPTLPRPQS
jgi:hypothetical protein